MGQLMIIIPRLLECKKKNPKLRNNAVILTHPIELSQYPVVAKATAGDDKHNHNDKKHLSVCG